MEAGVAGVDVGTASVRACIFDLEGGVLGRGIAPIALHVGPKLHATYAAEAIWAAVGLALRGAMAETRDVAVRALGFDATASLVLLDRDGAPLPLGPEGDTLAWCDQRAMDEALGLTASRHSGLALHGGAISPEMQLPKLLWLQRARPDAWQRLGAAVDLCDWLGWRATGSAERSLCALASKWGFDAASGWAGSLADHPDLAGLARLLPGRALAPGSVLGTLGPEAARSLGLPPGIPVAAGMIDAHAGTLASLGALPARRLDREAVLVAGTSSCLMALAPNALAARGLWGPHAGTVLPGRFTIEGGQSASGALLDHLIRLAGHEPEAALHARIGARIAELRHREGDDLAPHLQVVPDLNGARSPEPDPAASLALVGLRIEPGFDGLCRFYWRAAVALATGIASIRRRFEEAGVPIERVHLVGGHARNTVLVELYAAALGVTLTLPSGPAGEAMPRGAAIAASAAAGLHPSLAEAARSMAGARTDLAPRALSFLARDEAAQTRLRAALRLADSAPP